MKYSPSCIQAAEVRHPTSFWDFLNILFLLIWYSAVLSLQIPSRLTDSCGQTAARWSIHLLLFSLSSTQQTSRFGPAERGIWQRTKMAAECFGFKEMGAELRATLTGAKGDVRADRHMVGILSWTGLLLLSFDAPFFLLSGISADIQNVKLLYDILTKSFINLERREGVCVPVQVYNTELSTGHVCPLGSACVRS